MMITKRITVLFFTFGVPLVSSYAICNRANILPFQQLPGMQKRTNLSLLRMTASSSETQTDLDIPTSSDAAAIVNGKNSTNEDTGPTRKMRVSELKKALDALNIKYDDCFDQESLTLRYNEAIDQKSVAFVTNTTEVSPSPSKFNDASSNEQQNEELIQNIRQMSVKELREELGQRRVSRIGLFEKTDLIQAVYKARIVAQSFSVTGLLQPYMVTEVTGDQLQREIQNDSSTTVTTPLLVDVYATWCGPCQLMSKQLNDVANELGDTVRIVKLDSDQHTEVASQLRVQGLPTIILFGSNGSEINRIEGAMMKDQLIQWIQQQQRQ